MQKNIFAFKKIGVNHRPKKFDISELLREITKMLVRQGAPEKTAPHSRRHLDSLTKYFLTGWF
jgi:hypothetical protein